MIVPHTLTSRRRFLTVVALGSAASLLAACGGGAGALGGGSSSSSSSAAPPTAATASGSSAQTPQTAAPAQAGTNVTELVLPINQSPWLDAFRKVAAQYQSQSAITITLRDFPYGGLQTAMTNAIQAGATPFDWYLLDEPWTGRFYQNGWVTPFDAIDSSFALDPNIIDYDNLPRWDAAAKSGTPNGKVMGLPINGNVDLFMYRKDLFSDLGLSVPKTYEDALSNATKARDTGKVKYGFVIRTQGVENSSSMTFDFMPLLYGYGADWYTKDWKPDINSQGGIAAITMEKQLATFGPPNTQTVGQADVIAAMQSGQALQCQVVAAGAAQIEDESKSQVAGKVGYAVVPAGSSGKSAPTSGVWSMCIPAGLPTQRATAAYKFITWVLTADAQRAFVQAGGIPTRRDTYSDPSVPAGAQPYSKAVADSLPSVRRSIRYPFAADMYPIVETSLSGIVAGTTPIEKGMDDVANRLLDLARKNGYGA